MASALVPAGEREVALDQRDEDLALGLGVRRSGPGSTRAGTARPRRSGPGPAIANASELRRMPEQRLVADDGQRARRRASLQPLGLLQLARACTGRRRGCRSATPRAEGSRRAVRARVPSRRTASARGKSEASVGDGRRQVVVAAHQVRVVPDRLRQAEGLLHRLDRLRGAPLRDGGMTASVCVASAWTSVEAEAVGHLDRRDGGGARPPASRPRAATGTSPGDVQGVRELLPFAERFEGLGSPSVRPASASSCATAGSSAGRPGGRSPSRSRRSSPSAS